MKPVSHFEDCLNKVSTKDHTKCDQTIVNDFKSFNNSSRYLCSLVPNVNATGVLVECSTAHHSHI